MVNLRASRSSPGDDDVKYQEGASCMRNAQDIAIPYTDVDRLLFQRCVEGSPITIQRALSHLKKLRKSICHSY